MNPVPYQLSPEHVAAVSRRRRIVDQFDAMDVLRMLDADIGTWLRFAFNHADTSGSQIDSIWWDIGLSQDTYSIYESRILPKMQFPHLEKYWVQGMDWVAELVKACRARGIETFWNARINEIDMPQPWSESCSLTDPLRRNPLKAAHPDWVLPCWWWQGMWNLASPGLRAHKVSVLRELAEKYDFDGFSLDFARTTPCLPGGQQWQLREEVTEYVRQVRRALLDVARAKGRPILLAAKVPENLAGCRTDGFDVESWVKQGLVDILVLGSRTTTVAIDEFRRLVKGTPVKLIPIFDRHHATDGYYDPPLEYLRGVYANWWAQGADSVAIFNWPCAAPDAYTDVGLAACFNPGKPTFTRAVFEIGAPDTLRGKDMIFTVERCGGYPWSEGCHNRNDGRPLPCALPNDGTPAVLPLFVYEDFSAGPSAREISLTIIVWRASLADGIEVRFNGKALECMERDPEWVDGQVYADRPQPNAGDAWAYAVDPARKLLRLRFAVQPDMLRRGLNKVSLRLSQHGPRASGAYIEIEKTELAVHAI